MAALGVLALLARLPGLGRSLWYDELFTLSQFGGSLSQALTRQVAANNHPPASLLAWLMLHLDASEWTLRAPFALAGAAGVVGLAWAVARWTGRSEGLVSGVLAALLPLHVLASQQVRGYALMLAAATLLIGTLPSLLLTQDQPPTRRAWVAVIAACALGTWSHATFLACLVGTAACVVLLCDGAPRRRGLLALGGGALTGLLLLGPVLGRTFKFVRANVNVPDPQGLHPGALEFEQFGAALGDGSVLPLLLFALAGLGAGRLLSGPESRAIRLPALGGPALGLLPLLVARPLGYERFMLFAVPGLLGLAGVGLVGVAQHRRRRIQLGTVALALALALVLRQQGPRELQDYRGALRVARERSQTLGGAPVFGLGPGGELCAAYAPTTRTDPTGEAFLARLAQGAPAVAVVPLPAWLEGQELRETLWSEAFADPILLPGRESSVLVFATRKR